MDPYQGKSSGLVNPGASNKHRRTTSKQSSNYKQHSFAKNFLALDCSMATKTSGTNVGKLPAANEKKAH